MAFGCPSVSTRVGGIPEVTLDGETGLLVGPGDVAGLVDALVMLIVNPVRRARLGAAARVRAQTTFTAPILVEH
jgi:glycosyltransferase involved in cell wall biosynthesis